MSADPRVQRLLERMLETEESPEAVCQDTPELLDAVRAQWQRLAPLREELHMLFPEAGASPPATAAPPPTAQVPGYVVENVLGRGGMGIVYRARHSRLGRTVALKMLLSGADAQPTELARFRREAEVVATLRHPNIVQVYDVGEVDGIAWFTMEYLAGGTLARRTRAHVTARDAATLLATLADAIDCAHRSGVVHRDLKPSNVLLADDGTPKISDFGLCRRLDGVTALTIGGALGTPDYMAPEQLAGVQRCVGPAADVHALGAMLYELLAGQPPFRGATVAATLRQVLESEPTPPSRRSSRVPRDLETITLKCLQKDPARRYATAAELAADLQRFLRHEPIHARRVGPFERVVRWSQRRPAAAALVALAAVGSGYAIVAGIQAQVAAAEQRATGEAFATRLDDIERALSEMDLDHAESLLGLVPDGLPDTLRQRAATARADLQLVRRLDAIRLERTAIVGGRYDPWQNRSSTEASYEAAFAATPLRPGVDPPELVASRVRQSTVRRALVAAIDDWALCTLDAARRVSLLDIARRSDPDPGGWRDRARDPSSFDDPVALQRLAETAPMSESSAQLLTGLGEQLRAAKLDAKPFLLLVQQAFPNDFWANYLLGDTLLHSRQEAAEAIRYFQAAVAIRPKAMVARNGLGTALMDSGRIGEAIDAFVESSRLDPSYSETFCQYAMALHRQGDLVGAEAAYRESIRLDPTRSHVHHNFGNVLREQNRLDEALAEYREASRLEPENITPRYSIGMILRLMGRLDEALAAGKAIVAMGPSGGTHYELGMCYAQLERWAEAEQEFRRALAIEPTLRATLPALRNTLLVLGRHDEARQASQDYVATHPDKHEDYDGHAELCLFLGREDDYLEACRVLLQRFEGAEDPHVLERAGRACLLATSVPEAWQRRAAAMLERAVGTDASRTAPWARPYFGLGKALAEYRLGRFESATELLRGDAGRVLWPLPDLVLAMVLHRSGDLIAARETFTRAVLVGDWGSDKVANREAWIFHILRREAEAMIVPTLPDLLANRQAASSVPERAALLANRCFAGEYAAAVELAAQIFAERPELADEFTRGHRQQAATVAARAVGKGQPAQATTALRWLRADLAAWRRFVDGERQYRKNFDEVLDSWQRDGALAALRAPSPLPPAIADDCAAFWRDVATQRAWARDDGKR